MQDSALAATIILAIAFGATLMAMCISAALGALHILRDEEEKEDDRDVTARVKAPTRTTAPMRRRRNF